MEDIYKFEIDEEDYEKIIAGTKVVHVFVNNTKYKSLAIGNEITFVTGEGEEKKEIETIIESILYFPTITEAIESFGREKCGFKNSQTFDKATDQFLSNESYEHIEKHGVGAIVFKIKEKN